MRELVDKKATIYSDRPKDYAGLTIVGGDFIAFHQMGNQWRERRKYMARHFSPKMCDEVHSPIQEAEMRCFMNALLDRPR